MKCIPCLATLFLLFAPTVGHCDSPSIKLITEHSPFTQESTTNRSGGEATRFIQQVLAGAGISQELQYLPWRRAYHYVATEPNVMIFPLVRSAQREARFHWVGQLIPVTYYLFRLKGRTDVEIHNLDDARQYRIGVVNYHVHHEFLLSEGFTQLQPVNSYVQNLRKALLGRIDLFPYSDGGLVPLCEREKIDCSLFEPVFKLEEISGGFYMAYSLNTDLEIVESTRRSYQHLVEDGTHRRIFQGRFDNISRFNAMWRVQENPDQESKKRDISPRSN